MLPKQVVPLCAEDRVLHRTPLGFDVAIEEVFWPLLAGAVVVCAEPGSDLDARLLVQRMCATGVTVADFVPSLLERVLDVPELRCCSALRQLLCGGEAMTRALMQRCRTLLPKVELLNIYGPTEAIINALWWRADEAEAGPPPIGAALPGTLVQLVDALQRPVPAGEIGELWLGGLLAQGYVGQPIMPDERLVMGPPAGAVRWYRTGDRARQRDDGLFEFHGREDHQVKLRGARIELGEIEAALCDLDGVHEACVLVRGEGRQAHLLAWLGTRQPRSAGHWRAALAGRIPTWMRPALYQHAEHLPLTPTGKIDRAALAARAVSATTARARKKRLDTPLTRLLRQEFRRILALRTLDDDADFFESGGDSLQAAELLGALDDALGLELQPAVMYEHPTVRALAAHLEQAPQAYLPFSLTREFPRVLATPLTCPTCCGCVRVTKGCWSSCTRAMVVHRPTCR